MRETQHTGVFILVRLLELSGPAKCVESLCSVLWLLCLTLGGGCVAGSPPFPSRFKVSA